MTRSIAGLSLLVAISCSPGAAQSLTVNHTWSRTPSPAELRQAFPAKARAQEIEGFGVADCEVDPSGRLQDCRALREGPVGFGFGEAAAALGPSFILKRPEGSVWRPQQRIQVPIRFKLPGH